VIPSRPFHPVLRYRGRIVFVAAGLLQNVALSTVLGFAPKPLYAPYVYLAHRPGNLSALADQQIGAAIMWSYGDLPFVIVLSVFIHRWLVEQMQLNQSEPESAAGGIAAETGTRAWV
jgi:cytochrome c oxidase assembly factor CtaG